MWLTLVQSIMNWLGGPVVQGVVDSYKAKLVAGTASETLANDLAEKKVALDAQEAALNQQVVIAEQGRWYTACIRPLFAAPFVIYLWKLIVWDKVLGLGATDNLSPELWSVAQVVLVAYFGGRSLEKVAAVLKRK